MCNRDIEKKSVGVCNSIAVFYEGDLEVVACEFLIVLIFHPSVLFRTLWTPLGFSQFGFPC